MILTDAKGIPLAAELRSVSPAEVSLIESLLRSATFSEGARG
jgi:hypothetical protein